MDEKVYVVVVDDPIDIPYVDGVYDNRKAALDRRDDINETCYGNQAFLPAYVQTEILKSS